MTPSDVTFASLLEYGLAETAVLLNDGFADYMVSIPFELATLMYMVAHDGLDVGASRVMKQKGSGVGVALMARRGWSSRLAAMALIPEARGQGLGRRFMMQLLQEARDRGEQWMVLEVIEQNERAVVLYKKCGFEVQRRLVSYGITPATVGDEVPLTEVDIRRVAQVVMAHGLPDLPWQLSGETLALQGPPSRAYGLDDAYVVISDPERPTIGLRMLVAVPSGDEDGRMKRLLQAVMARYPGKTWRVPALFPEELAPLFDDLGFAPGEITQLQMALRLEVSP